MEELVGVLMLCMGAYLFWEPSYGKKPEPRTNKEPRKHTVSGELGSAMRASVRLSVVPRRGLRIYRAFGVVGALVGLLVASEIAIPALGGSSGYSPGAVRVACVVIGFIFGYTLPKVAENYIVVLGPPLTVVLGHEYLVYERGIDLQEVFSGVPIISEISHPALSSFLLVSTTFLTLTFRMYLRQIVPIFLSGLLSGGLIGNGGSILQSRSFPETPAEIELQISAIVALCSIALQLYVKNYGRDRSIKKERKKEREKRMSMGKNTGDVLVLRCPSCSEESPHRVVNRKEGAKGFEVLVNCRGLNQFDEICNFHHTVIEVARQ